MSIIPKVSTPGGICCTAEQKSMTMGWLQDYIDCPCSEESVDTLVAALQVGKHLSTEKYPLCRKYQTDYHKVASTEHQLYTCGWCNYEICTRLPCVCNSVAT